MTKSTFSKYLTPTYKITDFKSLDEMKKFVMENGGLEKWLLKTSSEGGFGDILIDDKLKEVLEG